MASFLSFLSSALGALFHFYDEVEYECALFLFRRLGHAILLSLLSHPACLFVIFRIFRYCFGRSVVRSLDRRCWVGLAGTRRAGQERDATRRDESERVDGLDFGCCFGEAGLEMYLVRGIVLSFHFSHVSAACLPVLVCL